MNGSSESNTDRERSGAGSQSPLLLVPMDDTISVQNIRNYLIFNGGKVKHAEIVSFFKRPLTDPVLKGRNRSEFKDILSKIANFRTESDERYIIIKSSSSKSESSPDQQRHRIVDIRSGTDSTTSSQSSLSTCDSGISLDTRSIAGSVAAKAREISKSTDSLDDELMSDIFEDEGSEDQYDGGQKELNPDEKKWAILSSICDCQKLASMMDKNPKLPAKRDFATGTALHWGAKLGRRDLVRLIADSGIDINVRTGQTALHLAAMQGHDEIIQMLINDYNADIQIRDYAGKKPKDLVKDTVSPTLQRKLGRSLILDPNIHLVCGLTRNSKDDHFARVGSEEHIDGSVTPETRRRLRTMSFLKKKKKWPPERNESDEETDRHKRIHRPKSSIVVLTPDVQRRYKEQSRSMTSFEF